MWNLAKIRDLLVHPKFTWVLAILAFLMQAPSLGAGYLIDDHAHRYFARGGTIPGGPRGVWDLYRFADGSPDVQKAIDLGVHAWWVDPHLKLAFFRPVTSMLRVVEERLFGDHAFFPHLISCLLFVATVLAVHAVFRRWIGGAAASLGALLFALDDTHAITVTWLAARHSLIALAACALSLAFFLRARDERKLSLGSGIWLLIALFSSEATLSILPFFLAVVVVEDSRAIKDRMMALVPIISAAVIWFVTYKALGYGSQASGYYIDPGRSPIRFIAAMAIRLPALAGGQLFFPPAEISSSLPALAPKFALFGLLLLGIAFFAAWKSRERKRAVALWVVFVVSLIPACGTTADDRLLMIPGVAAMGLIAVVCRSAYHARGSTGRLSWPSRLVFGGVAVVHVGMALLLSPIQMAFFVKALGGIVDRGAQSLYAFDHPEQHDLLVMTSPDGLLPSSMFLSRMNAHLPVARSSRVLATSPAGVVTLTRIDATSFSLTATKGMMQDPFVTAVRPGLFQIGDKVELPLFTVTVVHATPEGFPTSLLYVFRQSLNEPNFVFTCWHNQSANQQGGYRTFTLPKVGESMSLEAIDFQKVLVPD
jgi:hypothetical protein